jgi:peptidyl-prolyl cis-trans isomerase D
VLTKIREKIQGILAVLILGFLAIPFALWGIGSYFEGGADAPVAEVNGVEIDQRTYQQALDSLRRTNPEQLQNPAVKRLVLENLVNQTLVLSDAHASGYRTSNAQLAELIRGLPYFQKDGEFDPELYRVVLAREGLTPAAFEEQLRQESLPGQLRQGLSDSAFVTDDDVARAVRLLRQERRVSYAVIAPEAFLDEIEIEPRAIEEYYRANADAFRAPEAVRVAYLVLDASSLGAEVEPTEEELRRAYEAEAARYVTPERRRISHILIEAPDGTEAAEEARAEAEALLARLRDGADFAALAKAHSDDAATASKGGDLGEIQRGVLPEELEQAVFALEQPGALAGPVRTSYGYHLVKLIERTPEQRRAFDEVKDELREQVRARKGEEEFYELAERFRNLVYEHPEDLRAAAEALDLKVQTSDWFTEQDGSGIAADPRVRAAAFEPEVLEGERNSDAIELEGERMVALRVTEHRPAAIRPLAEVRAEIERRLKQERARERARETAEQWLAALGQGKPLAEVAQGPGARRELERILVRAEPGDTPPALLEAVFAAPRPEGSPSIGQVDLGPAGYAVYALEAVREPDLAAVDQDFKERVRRQLLQRRGSDYYRSYRQGLRETAEIEINEQRL